MECHQLSGEHRISELWDIEECELYDNQLRAM